MREVDSREAVHLEVDEPQDRDPAARAGKPDTGNASVDDLDVAPKQLSADDRGLDSEPPGYPIDSKSANAAFLCQAVSTSPDRQ